MICTMDRDPVVGRDPVLDQARHSLARPGVLLEGPAGIGKTAVWKTLRAEAESSGWRVLSAAPAESERLLPYAALADLLHPLADLIPSLPGPQRVAAEVVLVSADATDAFDERVVGAATRSLLQAAVDDQDRRPLLIAIDDAQWLDQPSERALRFALRRLTAAPGLLLTIRSTGTETVPVPLGLQQADPPLHRLVLTPLGVGPLHHILRARLGVAVSRPLLTRIAHDAGGNPLLAVELARAVLRLPELPKPGEDLPVVASVQQLLADSVSRLPPETRYAVRLAALLTSPTVADLVSAGVDPAVLEPAEEAGIVEVVGPALRFAHPLHASAVRAVIPAGVRSRLQRSLARTVADPDERARQLARGTVDPDADTAAELEASARRNSARGAPDLAAELYARAAELTPRALAAERSRRLLAGVRARFDSGDHGATERAAAAAALDLTGEAKAEALLLRATVAFVTVGHPPAISFAQEALASAAPGSPLAGRIHVHLAVFHDSPEAAIGHGEKGLALLRPGVGVDADTELYCSALLMVFYNEVRAGRPARTELLDEALRLEGGAPPWLGGSIPGLWWTAVDEHVRAAARMDAHLRYATTHGDEPLQLEVLLHLIQCELLAGQWDQAAEHLVQARDLGEQLGTGLIEENYLLAQLHIHRGELDTVAPVIEAGLRRAEELQDSWGRRVYGVLAGQLALLNGQYGEAARLFGLLAEEFRQQGLPEPLAIRWEPDWIEACVGAGDLATARSALHMLAVRHQRLPRPWTTLALARSRLLLASAGGTDPVAALSSLASALESVPVEVLPLDRARCLLVAGLTHRRAKRKREARVALEASVAGFTVLGAKALAARASAELARLGARPAAATDLSPTEQRVAGLAAQGLTNRVVADMLFISPKTVEANLARAYRKLGITSRAELGARMSIPGGPRSGVAAAVEPAADS